MFLKMCLFLTFSCCAFCVKVPDSVRMDIALKMHNGFCLQSLGHSSSAAILFNDTYREAAAAGISPKKLTAIGNLFMWYRKYGRYLGLFEASGKDRIIDEYWLYSKGARKKTAVESYDEALEIAEISRDMIFGVAEILGGLLGVAFLPELATKVGAGVLGSDGALRIWAGFNRLKKKNDQIAKEFRDRLHDIEAASALEKEW